MKVSIFEYCEKGGVNTVLSLINVLIVIQTLNGTYAMLDLLTAPIETRSPAVKRRVSVILDNG